MLPEELNRLIARAIDGHLRSTQESETILEADLGAAVGTEGIREQVAEVTLRERSREPMGHAKRARVLGHSQGGRQSDDREVRFAGVDRTIARRGRRLFGGRRRR